MSRLPLYLAAAIMVGTSAYAADLPAKKAAPAPAAAAPAPTLTDTIGIEVSPEFAAKDSGSATAGAVVDSYAKLSYAHTFDGTWVAGASYQGTQRTGTDSSNVQQFEATGAYKFKFDAITITPTLGLGYAVGTPKVIVGASHTTDSAPYYLVTLAGDYKLNASWTLNVFNVRYRNSFDGYWVTPKISTGVTYSISPSDAVYVSVGYAWKNTLGNFDLGHDFADKSNIAIGYKHSF